MFNRLYLNFQYRRFNNKEFDFPVLHFKIMFVFGFWMLPSRNLYWQKVITVYNINWLKHKVLYIICRHIILQLVYMFQFKKSFCDRYTCTCVCFSNRYYLFKHGCRQNNGKGPLYKLFSPMFQINILFFFFCFMMNLNSFYYSTKKMKIPLYH